MEITIFVSYSHYDKSYLADNNLVGYLKGLEQEEGVKFWSDELIITGDKWDDEIKNKIKESDIAIVLVSQKFLDSPYCVNVEIRAFLEKSRNEGLIIFPIILDPCDWQSHEWLKTRQFRPKEGKNILEHFNKRATRTRLFYNIRKDLKMQIQRIRNQKETSAIPQKEKISHEKKLPKLKKRIKIKKKVRIHELLKELNVNFAYITECLKTEGIFVNNPLSTITTDDAELIRKKIKGEKQPKKISINYDQILKKASYANAISASPDGSLLVTLHANRTVHLWPIHYLSHHKVVPLTNSDGYLISSAIRGDSMGWELIIGLTNKLERWLVSKEFNLTLKKVIPIEDLVHVQFSEDGSLLLVISSNGQVEVISVNDWKLKFKFQCSEKLRIGSFCFGNSFIIAGSDLGKIFIWNLEINKLVVSKDFHNGKPVTSLIGISSKPHFISTGEDGNFKFCKCTDGTLIKETFLKEAIICASKIKSKDLIFLGLNNNRIASQSIVWPKVHWIELLQSLPAAMTTVNNNKIYIVVSNYGRTIEIRDIENGKCIVSLIGFNTADWLAITHDNQFIGEGYEKYFDDQGKILKFNPEIFQSFI